MSIDAADMAELQRLIATMPKHEAEDLSALETTAELIGYLIHVARLEGWDEADMIELLIRLAEMTPDDVREAERVLRPLGYIQVADMMRKIAGRRKHQLAPLA